MRRLVLVLLLVAPFVPPSGADAASSAGSFTRHRFEASDDAFSRDYLVYVPAKRPPKAPLVVYLHGCNQTATDAAIGTRWNELAAKRGFVVVYPEQREDPSVEGNVAGHGNGTQCWNWFRPDLMGRDIGEPGTIAGITKTVTKRLRLDPTRVYVIGASAGADLATVMAALYPDVFAALGVLAGCPYLDCADVSGRAAYDAMGARARQMPVIAIQGTADYVNNLAMGAAAVQQWLGTNDLADNGTPDLSVSALPAAVEHHGLDGSAAAGVGSPGDLCAYATRYPCVGGAAGFKDAYPHSVLHYVDAEGGSLVDHWVIHGLGHAYPNGNTAANWTDPLGPDITTAAYAFFVDHPLR
jgi:poly(hydroxyalkanoate) depolymerase family esterase